MHTSNTGADEARRAGGAASAPIAVTMGDPEGIGLDITLMAWARRTEFRLAPFLVHAHADLLAERARVLGLDVPIAHVERADAKPAIFADALPVVPLARNAAGAAGVVASIRDATAAVARGEARAVVTNPITKSKPGFEALPYPGHTEFLADLAAELWHVPRPHPVMMLACETLRVVPATVHIPLARVPAALTPHLLQRTIEVTHAALVRDFGIAAPRLAIAGLNPHAGEDGLIGHEERDVIRPVLEHLRARGLDLDGPLSADTMFHAEARARYDAAIAMYHDQALIPIKTLAFDEGVNVTLGLPFVRTSPDHGTAFALAGTGSARPQSFIAALRLADRLAPFRPSRGGVA